MFCRESRHRDFQPIVSCSFSYVCDVKLLFINTWYAFLYAKIFHLFILCAHKLYVCYSSTVDNSHSFFPLFLLQEYFHKWSFLQFFFRYNFYVNLMIYLNALVWTFQVIYRYKEKLLTIYLHVHCIIYIFQQTLVNKMLQICM